MLREATTHTQKGNLSLILMSNNSVQHAGRHLSNQYPDRSEEEQGRRYTFSTREGRNASQQPNPSTDRAGRLDLAGVYLPPSGTDPMPGVLPAGLGQQHASRAYAARTSNMFRPPLCRTVHVDGHCTLAHRVIVRREIRDPVGDTRRLQC